MNVLELAQQLQSGGGSGVALVRMSNGDLSPVEDLAVFIKGDNAPAKYDTTGRQVQSGDVILYPECLE